MPVFRWVGIFLAALSILPLCGAIWAFSQGEAIGDDSFLISLELGFLMMGALLLLGAFLSFRHARFLGNLDESDT